MIAEEIIIAPIVTEKSNNGLQEGKYTFKVNKKATKVEIGKAVEKLFGVKVLNVNTMNVNGKKKRVGYTGNYGDEQNIREWWGAVNELWGRWLYNQAI